MQALNQAQGPAGAGEQDAGRAQGREEGKLSATSSGLRAASFVRRGDAHGRRRSAALLAPHPARGIRHRRPGPRLRRRTPWSIGAGGLGSPVALYLAARRGRPHHAGRRRRGRPHQPAAPDRPHRGARRPAQGATRPRSAMARDQPRRRRSQPHVQRADARAARRTGAAGRRGASTAATTSPPARRSTAPACSIGEPLVAGAAIRFDGQLSVYDTRDAASPCYACVFPPDAQFEETRCAMLGVFAPLVGTIGALQAGEALKLLAGIGESLAGRLLMFDGRSDQLRAPCACAAIPLPGVRRPRGRLERPRRHPEAASAPASRRSGSQRVGNGPTARSPANLRTACAPCRYSWPLARPSLLPVVRWQAMARDEEACPST